MVDDTTIPDWNCLPILIRSQVIHSKFPIHCVVNPPSNCYTWQFLLSSCCRRQSLNLEQWWSLAPSWVYKGEVPAASARAQHSAWCKVALFIRHHANRVPQSILFLRNPVFLFHFHCLHITLWQPSSTTHLKRVATNLACNRAAKPYQ